MLLEDIQYMIDGLDKSFEKDFERFDEFGDVGGIYDLRRSMVGLRNSEILVDFDRIAHYVIEDNNFKDNKSFKEYCNFYLMAHDNLRVPIFPIYLSFLHDFVDFSDIESLLMLINFNYFYYSKMKCSRVKVVKEIFGGNIIEYLSFLTDDFMMMDDLPDYDENFFNKLKKVNFKDKKSKKLENFLMRGYLCSVTVEQKISVKFYNHIKFSARYLMACNALKRGSLEINCDDVVVGYSLTLKLITEDIRPYVRKASSKY
ncbi:MAG: hypothetical protein E7Z80_04485 [Methanobrevibacter thaueri]|nr:hypothetical protein [Methanobrevibacter thaueri]